MYVISLGVADIACAQASGSASEDDQSPASERKRHDDDDDADDLDMPDGDIIGGGQVEILPTLCCCYGTRYKASQC